SRLRPGYAGTVLEKRTATIVFDATDGGVWTVELAGGRGRARRGSAADPTLVVHSSAATLARVVSGEASGVTAFLDGDLTVRGDLALSLQLDGLFAHQEERPVHFARALETTAMGVRTAYLEAGPPDAPPVILLHGLGASKVSLLPVVAGLSAHHRVIALDFPGFGKSSSPVGAPYDAAWFAKVVRRTMDAAEVDSAFLVGNSMGGRVSVELALQSPERVRGIGLLCPAVAFDEYRLLRPFLQASRLDLALGVPGWKVPGPLPGWIVRNGLRAMFADHTRVPAANLDAAQQDFLRSIDNRRRRLAFLACTRRLGMESPARFWPRLVELQAPSLWVFGDRDRLVSPNYAELVRSACPTAHVEVWDSCGHVPQFEHPHVTNQRLREFFAAC
ncbi:MAG TPA: alpha/beta fold hydrolase, partial [Egibacteraceae bacterium]|nr:alpha/beta fold hydrolase [Egibacteraceae bacterium]